MTLNSYKQCHIIRGLPLGSCHIYPSRLWKVITRIFYQSRNGNLDLISLKNSLHNIVLQGCGSYVTERHTVSNRYWTCLCLWVYTKENYQFAVLFAHCHVVTEWFLFPRWKLHNSMRSNDTLLSAVHRHPSQWTVEMFYLKVCTKVAPHVAVI